MSDVVVNETDKRLSVLELRKFLGKTLDEIGLLYQSYKDEVHGAAQQVGSRSQDVEQSQKMMEAASKKAGKIQSLLALPDDKIDYWVNLLRNLRGHLAHAKSCKPYVIYPDAVLIDLLIYQPKTIEDLSVIRGFPSDGNRIQKWGPAVITIFGDKEVAEFRVTESTDGEPSVTPIMQRMSSF